MSEQKISNTLNSFKKTNLYFQNFQFRILLKITKQKLFSKQITQHISISKISLKNFQKFILNQKQTHTQVLSELYKSLNNIQVIFKNILFIFLNQMKKRITQTYFSKF